MINVLLIYNVAKQFQFYNKMPLNWGLRPKRLLFNYRARDTIVFQPQAVEWTGALVVGLQLNAYECEHYMKTLVSKRQNKSIHNANIGCNHLGNYPLSQFEEAIINTESNMRDKYEHST